jgi:hypothetical protein
MAKMARRLNRRQRLAALDGKISHLERKVKLLAKYYDDSLELRFRHLAEDRVSRAIRCHQLTPDQREWAIFYCMEDPTEFEKFIASPGKDEDLIPQ